MGSLSPRSSARLQQPPDHLPARRRNLVLSTIVALGVALRLWQYLADTSMWFDELSIARNISERSFAQLLTQPLGFQQTAPLGFLAAIDVAKHLFGPSDMSLRIFPFICGILALFLFRRVAERTLEGAAVPIAVGLFAIPAIRFTYIRTAIRRSHDTVRNSVCQSAAT